MEECGAQHPCELSFVFPLRVLREHCGSALDDVQHKTGILKKSIILGAAGGTPASHFRVFVSHLTVSSPPQQSNQTFRESALIKILKSSSFSLQWNTFHMHVFFSVAPFRTPPEVTNEVSSPLVSVKITHLAVLQIDLVLNRFNSF